VQDLNQVINVIANAGVLDQTKNIPILVDMNNCPTLAEEGFGGN
jgi:hypothetical protein